MKSKPDELNCSRHVKDDIESSVAIVSSAFGSSLLGIVLTGSLARDCFQLGVSDVDLLVVLDHTAMPIVDDNGAITESDSECLKSMQFVADALQNLSTPFDIMVMTDRQLTNDLWPTPIVGLLKPPGRVVMKPDGSRDALLQRQDAFEAGIVIMENNLPRVLPVPQELIDPCVRYIFPHIRTRFKNPALMLCRVWYWYERRRLCSKIEAGTLAMQHIPFGFRRLIEADLQAYRSGRRIEPDNASLIELECWIKNRWRR